MLEQRSIFFIGAFHAARKRKQECVSILAGLRGLLAVVIVGIAVIKMAAFTDSFEHIRSAGTELLAKPQPPARPPVSMESFPVVPGHRFESVANDIARLEGRSIDLSSCPPKLTKSAVASGTVHSADAAGLIEEIRGLLGHGAPLYVVRLDRDRGVYEVRCE